MQRQVLGVDRTTDLHALAATTDPDDKSALNKLLRPAARRRSVGRRANMGTAVHAAIEAVNRGRDAPVMFAEHVEAYTTLLDGIGATVDRDHVEQFVVNETVGAAGTFDMRLQVDGVWYVADLKTGSTVEWSARSFAIQLAIYQGHVHLRLGDEHPRPAAGPRRRPRHHRPPPRQRPVGRRSALDRPRSRP